jgi:hypothetical protein
MGKLIISETERKNILSLYEETNITPPPSESILVANKNPFKYPEYESARRIYSSDLKDGELFYMINERGFRSYLITKLDEKLKLLNNKTIRINDKIYGFRVLTPNVDVIYKWPFMSRVYLEFGLYDSENIDNLFYKVYIDWSEHSKYYYVSHKWKASNLSDSFKNPETGNLPSTTQDIFLKQIQNEADNLDMNDFPDNIFEIRKIQRQQTDF